MRILAALFILYKDTTVGKIITFLLWLLVLYAFLVAMFDTAGKYIFWGIIVAAVAYFFLSVSNFDWLDKEKRRAKKEAKRKALLAEEAERKQREIAMKYGHNLFTPSTDKDAFFWLSVTNNEDGKETGTPFFEDDKLKLEFSISDDFLSLKIKAYNKTDYLIQIDFQHATFMDVKLKEFDWKTDSRKTVWAHKTMNITITNKPNKSKKRQILFYEPGMKEYTHPYVLTFSITTQATTTRDYSLTLKTNCIRVESLINNK